MLKVLGSFLLISSLMYGVEGKSVYDRKCASCHELYIPFSTLEKNFNEFDNKMLHLKAPTINQIVYRLKARIGDPSGDEDMHRMEIESFLEDYLNNPDKDKSVCLPEILKYFETMPSMKGQLNEEEFESIVSFLYDYDPKNYQSTFLKYYTFEEASIEALAQNKLIMIFYTAEHCRYCKKMEREVLSDSDVIAALQKEFVSVKIDVDKDKNPIDFNPTMTPTFLFLSPTQEQVYRVPGSWIKEDYLEILREAKEKYNQYQKKGAQ
ncbi:thioredoxin family protein [Sulfurovum sp. zt1-1]|uniref:Thioredoxin family protein n=1 Tax=Sulfurovum zhangzhouensis TaxID=3019067 RepID=A0ABT7R0W1_9BACT|nr:thioredoxin fold domain-containing protein [Sulfurovum zhangzhouensis]MDM5272729.1 thioredoxin family protein [Sulfurovum zhangzhouensis]